MTEDANLCAFWTNLECIVVAWFFLPQVAGLFKGITPPLIGNALCNSIVFGVYGNVMRILSKDDKKTGNTGGFSFRKITIASVAVGFAQSLIVCPMELIKAKLQIQTNSVNRLYTSEFSCHL